MDTYLAALEAAEGFAIAEGRVASVVYDTATRESRAVRGYASNLSDGVMNLHVVTPDGLVWSTEEVSVVQQLSIHVKQRSRETEPLTLREIQDTAVTRALARHNGDKPRAAKELGIALKTIYNRINRTGSKDR